MGALTDTGSGRYAFRLAIAGVPYEAVTDLLMATTGTHDGYRAPGLLREGLVFDQKVDMARATLDVSPLTVRLVDVPSTVDGVTTPWTKLFSKQASNRTWLNATCTASSATLAVRSTAGFPSSGTIYIDQEAIFYTGTTGTTFTGCSRGFNNTLPTYHYSLDTTNARAAEITDWPLTMEGRHCWFYRYTDTDSPTGNGTQVWVGKVSRDARLVDGTTWELGIDPITRLFQEPLGGDLGPPMRPGGIYYPWGCCFYLACYVSTDATRNNVPDSPTWSFQLTGHYKTQDEFCAAVQAQIDTNATTQATGKGLECHADGPDGYHFELRTAAATPRWVGIDAISPLDKIHHAGKSTRLCPWTNYFFDVTGAYDDTSTTVGTSTVYRYPTAEPAGVQWPSGMYGLLTHTNAIGSPGAVPRGAFLPADGASDLDLTNASEATRNLVRKPADATTAPNYRVYVDGYQSLAAVASVTIDYSGTGDGPQVHMGLLNHDDTTRYLDLQGPTAPALQSVCFAGMPGPGIVQTRDYGHGTLKDLRTAIIASVQQGAALGTAPYIYDLSLSDATALTSDFAAWSAVDTAAAGRVVARRFWSSSKALRLGDVLTEEAKNIGCYFALDSQGRIEVLQVGVAANSTTWTISSSKELTDRGMSGWERNALGSIAEIAVSLDYDPSKDDFNGPPVVFREVTAYGRNPTANPVEIKPRSQVNNPSMLLATLIDDYNTILSPVFGIFSYPYDILTIDVPFSFDAALVGDAVSVTSKNLPSGTGGRGMSARSGIIIGIRKSYADAAITLTILASEVNYAGYTPTSRISGSVDNGGNNWTFTIATPAASGVTRSYSDATAWQVNDVVRVVTWDTTTSTISVNGTVTVVTATTVRVQFTGVHVAAGTQNLEYALSSATWSTNQRAYCAVAPSTARIDYGGGTSAPARQLAG